MPGESVPQGLWLPPRVATLLIAASDSLDRSRAQADYLCDGIADEVQINQALNALPASGGRVMLSEGTFVIDDPIVIPANNIWLRGMGRSTIINGNGLANGENAIELVGRTGCAVKKLAVEISTAVGTRHCVFADNGCNNLTLHDITIIDSDSDGIHIEGTNVVDIHIRGLRIDDVDDYGVYAGMDALNWCDRLIIDGALIVSAGIIGIRLGRCRYSEISNSVVAASAQTGINLDVCEYCDISNCISVLNTQHGIIMAGGATHCLAEGCNASLNGYHGIYLNDSDECIVSGCVCSGNDFGDTNTYDGIYVDADSVDNNITNNHCCENDRYGLGIDGARNNLQGNFAHENSYHGINVAGTNCVISNNYCIDNSQHAVGTYHGINLAGGADRCLVEGNYLWSGPDHDKQEDGISLESGAVSCSIIGNYCYYLQGDGIRLQGSNDNTLIKGNHCWQGSENGIAISDSVDCTVNGNRCTLNVHHGIYLDNADRADVVGNTCNDNGDIIPANYDGINVDADCDECLLDANIANSNHRYGINIMGGARHVVSNNQVNTNQLEGIICAGADTIISDNWCYDNGQKTAGTYHGIDLAGTADRCQVNGNHIDGNGDATQDGIHLESGAIDCQINDNYIYNMMGSGICLAADNLDCEISGNYVRNCDDYGIEVLDGCDRCMINDNKCYGNANHGIYLNANDYCSIVGNICNGNTGAATDGINLNGCDYCTISGNVCTGNGDDGIVLVATSTKCIVIGNQLLGNGGDPLTDGGTNTEASHNIIA